MRLLVLLVRLLVLWVRLLVLWVRLLVLWVRLLMLLLLLLKLLLLLLQVVGRCRGHALYHLLDVTLGDHVVRVDHLTVGRGHLAV